MPLTRLRTLVAVLVLLLGAAVATPAVLLVRQQQQAEQVQLELSQRRVQAITRITTLAVEGVLRTSRDAVQAQARRPETTRALTLPPGPARDAALGDIAAALQRADTAALTSFVVEPDGVLARNWPEVPDLWGRSFAERDWYRGALAQYPAYVSEGFRSAVPGQPLVVSIVRAVRDGSGRVVGLLGNGVELSALQSLVDAQSGLPGLTITVVDRYGQVLARTGGAVESVTGTTERRLRTLAPESGPRSGRPRHAEDGEVWSLARLRGQEGAVLVEVPGRAVVGDLVAVRRSTGVVLGTVVLVLLGAGAASARLVRSRLRDQRALARSEAQLRGLLDTVEAQRHAAEEAGALHRALLSATPDVLYLHDVAADEVSWVSDGATTVLGCRPEQLLGPAAAWRARVHPDDLPACAEEQERVQALEDGAVSVLRFRLRGEQGWRWVSRRTTPFRRTADGRLEQVLSSLRDVSDVVAAEERLRAAAERDALTGLPNRALLSDRLDAALARSRRSGELLAVLLVDLDGFKAVNDSAGHQAGDALLVEVARRLEGCVRAGDTVARLGGDEFVLVLEHRADELLDPYSAALVVARRVQEAVAAPVLVDGVVHRVTASTGLALSTPDVLPGPLLARADAAMYRAKTGGKDRVEVAPAPRAPVQAVLAE